LRPDFPFGKELLFLMLSLASFSSSPFEVRLRAAGMDYSPFPQSRDYLSSTLKRLFRSPSFGRHLRDSSRPQRVVAARSFWTRRLLLSLAAPLFIF